MKLVTADGKWQAEVVTIDGRETIRVRSQGYLHGYAESLDGLTALGVPVTELEEAA